MKTVKINLKNATYYKEEFTEAYSRYIIKSDGLYAVERGYSSTYIRLFENILEKYDDTPSQKISRMNILKTVYSQVSNDLQNEINSAFKTTVERLKSEFNRPEA